MKKIFSTISMMAVFGIASVAGLLLKERTKVFSPEGGGETAFECLFICSICKSD